MSLRINLLPVKLFSKWQDLSPYLCLCMVNDKTTASWGKEKLKSGEKRNVIKEYNNKKAFTKKEKPNNNSENQKVREARKKKVDDENSKNKYLNQQCNN